MLFLLKLTPTKLQFIITSLNHNGSPIVQWKYRLKKKSLKFLIILPVFYLLKFKNCIKTHKNINFTKMRQNKRNMKLMSASFKKITDSSCMCEIIHVFAMDCILSIQNTINILLLKRFVIDL